MSSIPDREAVRTELATQLATACPSAAAVYPYQKSRLLGESPVIRIVSANTSSPRLTFAGGNLKLRFSIQVIVLYQDPENDGSYTEEDAESQFDATWAEVMRWIIETAPSGDTYRSLEVIADSEITKFPLGGATYLAELIPVEVQAR